MKILIADDCPSTLDILRISLTKWGYEPLLVNDGEQAFNILKLPAAPRLAILDWSMPKLDGVSVCRQLRARSENALNYTYLVVLTARDREEGVVEAFEAGADDYLTKPVRTRELQVRVRAGERIIELQDRLVRTNRKLALMTTHDRLTKVFNREAILERLTHEIERSARASSDLSFLTTDIDQFKAVNLRYGHQAGDELLTQVADRFKAAIRSYDVLGRVGGDEFAIVFPDTGLNLAAAMAERLCKTVQNQPFQVGSDYIRLSISFGVASSSTERHDRRKLVNSAEKALKQASAEGGNRVLMWDSGEAVDPLRKSEASALPSS